ncbi:hypothetical protein M0802_012242 [Mischocyttarus mexicanus]|nr:hypothetical protein M0802_012242 [Mischocyttarus mexicanus]
MKLGSEDAITREVDRRYGRGGNGRRDVVMGSTPVRGNSRMEREPRYVVTGSNNFRSEQRETRRAPANRNCYYCGSDRRFIRDCPKSRPLSRDFRVREPPSIPPDQIKYTVSQQTEMNLQPCKFNWEAVSPGNSSQILAQQ